MTNKKPGSSRYTTSTTTAPAGAARFLNTHEKMWSQQAGKYQPNSRYVHHIDATLQRHEDFTCDGETEFPEGGPLHSQQAAQQRDLCTRAVQHIQVCGRAAPFTQKCRKLGLHHAGRRQDGHAWRHQRPRKVVTARRQALHGSIHTITRAPQRTFPQQLCGCLGRRRAGSRRRRGGRGRWCPNSARLLVVTKDTHRVEAVQG